MVPRIIVNASEKIGSGDKLALMIILFLKQREMMQIVPFGFWFTDMFALALLTFH